jgi:glycosyltransferase involved in cell wall biosynthesis
MKVLYVSYDGMTDALGRSQVIPYLVGLSAKGHTIHIISCEKKQILQEEIDEVADIFKENNISWHPLSFSSRPPWISKLLDVFKIRIKSNRLHTKEQFDVVHCRSYIAALAGLDLKIRHQVKFVFDMRGFWANERIDGDMWNLSNPVYGFIYKYFKKKEKEFFRQSDAVVSLTHNGKSVIKELFGESVDKKTTVIPCCVDTQFFSARNIVPEQLSALKTQLGFSADDFILSYLGSTGTWYMTDEMLLFFKKMLVKYTNARFLFISGDHPDFIHSRARYHGIAEERIVIVRASRNLVPLYLSLSAASIFFIRPVFSKKASSPTKQAEIMSMGIPLICNAGVGDTDMLFSDEQAGLVLRDFSDGEMESAINRMDSILAIDPALIRQKAVRFFNLKDGVDSYNEIYVRINAAESAFDSR